MTAMVESHVDARMMPWNRLGTVFGRSMTAEEALTAANLSGWNVRKSPAMTMVDGEVVEMPGRFAVIRNNPFDGGKVDVLGDVGNVWTPTQNEEHAEFLNTLTDTSGANFESAGSYNDGRNVFVAMKMPETILVGGMDPVDTFILAVNSHDGSSSFRVITTPVRQQCTNMIAATLRGAKRVASVRHTAGSGGAIARVRESLAISFRYQEAFELEAERMIQESLTKGAFDKIVAELYPLAYDASNIVADRTTSTRSALRSLFESSETMTGIKGTRWSGYNAVTEFIDHMVTVPGANGSAAALKRAEYNLTGKSDSLKEMAFQLFSA